MAILTSEGCFFREIPIKSNLYELKIIFLRKDILQHYILIHSFIQILLKWDPILCLVDYELIGIKELSKKKTLSLGVECYWDMGRWSGGVGSGCGHILLHACVL